MYVIGRSDYDFIKVVHGVAYDGQGISMMIESVEYNLPSGEVTIFPDYETAKDAIKIIQENAEDIKFTNSSIVGEILDRESFDKIAYSKELKIYELVPTEVNE